MSNVKDQKGLTIYKPDVRVYVAGPYSVPDKVANTRVAIIAGNTLLDMGFVPFIPHLSHFWDFLCPQKYSVWLEYDLHWLRQCDAVLRLPGESKGADAEVAEAVRLNIPVFESISDLVAWEFDKPKKKTKRNKT